MEIVSAVSIQVKHMEVYLNRNNIESGKFVSKIHSLVDSVVNLVGVCIEMSSTVWHL